MAETKHDKYILRGDGPEKTSPEMPGVISRVLKGSKDWSGIQHRLNWKYITKPVLIADKPHSHDFEEFLCFLGCNPADPDDFGAEIELSMGEEGEKHIINTRAVVCIPKGMVHCPLNFKKIGKPILFCNIYLAPEYVRKPA